MLMQVAAEMGSVGGRGPLTERPSIRERAAKVGMRQVAIEELEVPLLHCFLSLTCM